jgi:putative nucleotidyltransferase with HDIG domain
METSLDINAANQPAAAARLASLFTRPLRVGQLHPLLHHLEHYRNAFGALEVPIDRTEKHAATPPKMKIDAELLHKRIGELPALPQVVLELIALLRNEEVRLDDCVSRIERDLTLAARTLRLANSAFYGVPGRVANIRDAVQILGLRAVGTLLTTAAVSSQFGRPACPGFDFSAFWRHSIATAIAARTMARMRRLDDDLAFTAGLLHDIGLLALATQFPAELGVAIRYAQETETPALDAEQLVSGTDHVAAGTAMVRHWHFPSQVIDVIKHHHAPNAAHSPGLGATVADAVHIADAIAHGLDLAQVEHERVPEIELMAWNRLGFSNDDYQRILSQTETGVAGLCQALAI